jgi:hypothetical protein
VLESFMQYISTVLCCKWIAAEGLEKNWYWCAWCGKKNCLNRIAIIALIFCATYVHLSKVFKSFLSVFTCSFKGYGNSYWFHCCLNFTIICFGGTKTTGKQTKTTMYKKMEKKRKATFIIFLFSILFFFSFDKRVVTTCQKERNALPETSNC